MNTQDRPARPGDPARTAGVVVVEQDGTLAVLVSCEVSTYTADDLRGVLLGFLDGRREALLVDVTRVTWFDPAGVALLLDVHRAASACGTRMAVVGSDTLTARAALLAGISEDIVLHPSRSAAIKALTTPRSEDLPRVVPKSRPCWVTIDRFVQRGRGHSSSAASQPAPGEVTSGCTVRARAKRGCGERG
ncbi:STAS domain-containing protein [Lentzea sp. HUAS12]|uniref:STAS domain-containing protein n=1 Tax=Lentzea sp. HUAS12 TaxID=2951806 RepID=UPI0020A074B5|nr:STAS domain-containing protein [Lentzea sp. HUAS12]USX52313.1 STAS domain-containing protein [Lentzea sp. HUAS12]